MTDLLDRRRALMGPNVPTFYREPLNIVRGEGVWLWDDQGKKYLDCYNNVPHVGHCHPRVVDAICRQSALLNTHTRYLHDGILNYIDALTATLQGNLDQMIMVCTGSEANDIALRMAQAVTGATGVIATDNTYHGNTLATAQLSTRRPPIGGYPPHVRLVPAPVSGMSPDTFADGVRQAIAELKATGFGVSGMMLCPIFANEGFPSVPPGFLDDAATAVRAEGGILLCDEVQPGFGRVGSHFWGHEWLGIEPEVITLGKPMANGYPVAAVVARPDIMAAFRTAFGYFNTYGGNPVAAAAALETLRIVQEDKLASNAAAIGDYALQRLKTLDHPAIVEARGNGLFFGIEFGHPDGSPATQFAEDVVEGMVHRGILLNRIGRHMNTLKMRPPMPIKMAEIDLALDALQDTLKEVPWTG